MLDPKLIRSVLILLGAVFLVSLMALIAGQPVVTRASLATSPPRSGTPHTPGPPPPANGPGTVTPTPTLPSGKTGGKEAPTGGIYGQVIDLSTAEPGRGLDIEINGVVVRTDSDGKYSLTSLAAGTYTVVLHLPNGATPAQSSGIIYLGDGETVTLDLNYRSQSLPTPTPTDTPEPTPTPLPTEAATTGVSAAPTTGSAGRPSDVFSPLTASTGDTPAVWINPGHINNQEGVVGHIAVDVANVEDFGAFQATLKFDPKIIEVDDVVLGNFLESTGRETIPLVTEIDNTAGQVSFVAFTSGEEAGPDGGGTLAVVNFISKQAGVSGLEMDDVLLVARLGKVLDARVGDGLVSVTACLGDLNGDKVIDVSDLQTVAGRVNQAFGDPNYVMEYDLNNNGLIDDEDVSLITERLYEACP